MEVGRSFLYYIWECCKHKFLKKSTFSKEWKNSPIFSRIIEHKNCQWPKNKGPQCFLTSMVQSFSSFFWDLRNREPIFSKLKLSSRRKNNLAHFFSYYPPLQTLTILFLGSTKYLGNYDASYKIFSLAPKRLFKTQIFLKKGNLFSEKLCLHYEFSPCRVWQTSGNDL